MPFWSRRKPEVLPANPGFRNRIVGVVRFSYPALSAFSRTPADAAAAKAMLYDPERLERRFRLFEALMLPSMLAQTDGDFQLGFVIGDDFPKPWRDRLQDLIRPLQGAYLHPMEPAQNYKATHAAYRAARLDGASHFTTFRLDDDDAMDRDFIARLRRQADRLSTLAGPQPWAIGHNSGFWLEIGAEGNRLYDVHERTPACGVALVSGIKSGLTIYVQNHRDIAERFSTWLDAETPAFIRTVHRDNDASPHVAGKKGLLPPDEVRALVERHFPFTLDGLMRL
mgnify:CR=1 FL=1